MWRGRPSREETAKFFSLMVFRYINLYLRCFSATPTMNTDGNHIGGLTGFLLSMGAAIRQHRPTRVVVVFDGKGGSQRRRQIFKDYKANRRMMTKLNRTYDFQTLDDEQQAMKWQLVKLVTMLQYLPVTVMHIDNVEADDVISYLAMYIEKQGGKSVILSTDKDFLQLVNDNITVYNPAKKKMYRPDNIVQDYGFHPHNFLLYRVVTGDKSDNIPGVDGIKEKTLLKHFPELAESDKKDIDFLLESAQQQIDGKKKPPTALKTLINSKTLLYQNLQLMRLDDGMAMSTHARMKAMELFDQQPPKLNKYELTKLASSDKILGAFPRWDEWVIGSFAPLNRYRIEKGE